MALRRKTPALCRWRGEGTIALALEQKPPPCVVRWKDKAARPARHEKRAPVQAGSLVAGGGVVRPGE
ncbi:MAG: hypothetical protein IPN65_03675 [Elusimicrobia bacterium]|nr:hypothetical protein [Elusimicrobiota bacterium]MBK7208672.1 hypothetical protein [Elusimicrobiota bacterium]MBK7545415.1 hypothetical protein [Elusimicrobiota bacterium]MBK8127102.1 hypothetical protein [Elusimicrobiota bacterium]MBK8424264.1 hypothetical protein [Elusimicrobiota bacterium]